MIADGIQPAGSGAQHHPIGLGELLNGDLSERGEVLALAGREWGGSHGAYIPRAVILDQTDSLAGCTAHMMPPEPEHSS